MLCFLKAKRYLNIAVYAGDLRFWRWCIANGSCKCGVIDCGAKSAWCALLSEVVWFLKGVRILEIITLLEAARLLEIRFLDLVRLYKTPDYLQGWKHQIS